jgi:hypothetical protein
VIAGFGRGVKSVVRPGGYSDNNKIAQKDKGGKWISPHEAHL